MNWATLSSTTYETQCSKENSDNILRKKSFATFCTTIFPREKQTFQFKLAFFLLQGRKKNGFPPLSLDSPPRPNYYANFSLSFVRSVSLPEIVPDVGEHDDEDGGEEVEEPGHPADGGGRGRRVQAERG